MPAISEAAEIVLHIKREMGLHLDYCMEQGLRAEAVEAAEEATVTVAYSRWLMDLAHSGDFAGVWCGFAPCLVGYGDIAARIWEEEESRKGHESRSGESLELGKGNRYWRWVEQYSADDYREAVRKGKGTFEQSLSFPFPRIIHPAVMRREV